MNQKTILLVEYSPDDEALALRALRNNHLADRILVVRDGVQALDLPNGRGMQAADGPLPAPEANLLDLKLPRLEVHRPIRCDGQTKPIAAVVVVSSSIEDQDRLQGYRPIDNSHVHKPNSCGQFVNAVSRLGLYWLLLNPGRALPVATR